MVIIKRNKKEFNEYSFSAKWTAGEILALHQALKLYAPHSPVTQDVLNEVERAMKDGDELYP